MADDSAAITDFYGEDSSDEENDNYDTRGVSSQHDENDDLSADSSEDRNVSEGQLSPIEKAHKMPNLHDRVENEDQDEDRAKRAAGREKFVLPEGTEVVDLDLEPENRHGIAIVIEDTGHEVKQEPIDVDALTQMPIDLDAVPVKAEPETDLAWRSLNNPQNPWEVTTDSAPVKIEPEYSQVWKSLNDFQNPWDLTQDSALVKIEPEDNQIWKSLNDSQSPWDLTQDSEPNNTPVETSPTWRHDFLQAQQQLASRINANNDPAKASPPVYDVEDDSMFATPIPPSSSSSSSPPQKEDRMNVDLASDSEAEKAAKKVRKLRRMGNRTLKDEVELRKAMSIVEEEKNRKAQAMAVGGGGRKQPDKNGNHSEAETLSEDDAAKQARAYMERARGLRSSDTAKKQRRDNLSKVTANLAARKIAVMNKEQEKARKKAAAHSRAKNKTTEETSRKKRKNADDRTGPRKNPRKQKAPKLSKNDQALSDAWKTQFRSMGHTTFVGGDGEDCQPNFRNRKNQNHNRKDAMNDMIASIPLKYQDDAKEARCKLEKACKRFPRGAIKPGNVSGYWTIRGLITDARHHQILGCGFMLERENGSLQPKGGLVCDAMGFGKTLQCIAVMMSAKAAVNKPQATLVVCPTHMVDEWMAEIAKHVDPRYMGSVLAYTAGSRLEGLNLEQELESKFCVITTYGEILSSLKGSECPNELTTADQVRNWYAQEGNAQIGLLHRVQWHRVILDEGHTIKNWRAATSQACTMLEADRRWIVSGTPLMNDVFEVYSYLLFLRCDIAGSYEQFVSNYSKESESGILRLQQYLSGIMLRRVYGSKLFGVKILDELPKHVRGEFFVDFTPMEREIYNIIKARMVACINTHMKKKHLARRYMYAFKMMLVLRQASCHFMLVSETCKNILTYSDRCKIEAVVTEYERDGQEYKTIRNMRAVLAEQDAEHSGVPALDPDSNMGSSFGAIDLTGAQILGRIDAVKDADEDRGLCMICHTALDSASEYVETPCGHCFCEECIEHEIEQAVLETENPKAAAQCPKCGEGYESPQIKKVPWKSGDAQKQEESMFRENQDQSWPDDVDGLIPSAKLLAFKSLVLEWRFSEPDCKIIVYTHWIHITRCLARLCGDEQWDHDVYTGKINRRERTKIIERFTKSSGSNIMISTLKAGGTGLNLTAANKIISLDLWYNYGVEEQAFHRIYRLGQKKETAVMRLVVRNTIDEDLIAMQNRKLKHINKAHGENGYRKEKLTLEEILALFGPVRLDADGDLQVEFQPCPGTGDQPEIRGPRGPPFVNPDHESGARQDLIGHHRGGERGVPVRFPKESGQMEIEGDRIVELQD